MRKIIVFVILIFTTHSVFSQNLKENISVEDKIHKLSVLWKEVHYNFAFIDQLGFDLDSLYKESIKRAIKTKNNFEFIGELGYFLNQLNDGHTSILQDQPYWDQVDFPDVFTTIKEGKDYVTKIGRNYVNEIPLGSILTHIDGVPIKEMREKTYNAVLLGFRGSSVCLKFIKPNGKIIEKNIIRNSNKLWKEGKIDWVTLPKNKPLKTSIESRGLFKIIKGFSVVHLKNFSAESVVKKFKSYVYQINKSNGLIIDVRGNSGGNGDYALEIAKHLVKQNYILTESWKTQTHNAAKKAWASINNYNSKNPYAKKYKDYYNTIQWETHSSDSISISKNITKINVPIAILTDKGTFSAAEDFLIYTDIDKSIIRIGQPSAGSSGQPLHVNLFEYVYARICAKRDAMADGTDYIGVGIQPHIEVDKEKDILKHAISYLSKK